MTSSPLDPAFPDLEALWRRAAEAGIAYRRKVGEGPQRPLAGPLECLQAFEAPTPEEPSDAEAVLEELIRLAEPGLQHSTGPRFFSWVIGASHPLGVAADWLTAVWGQNAAGPMVAPSAAAAEAVAERWLLDILELPRDSRVGFATGATMANAAGLAAARSELLRRRGWDVEAQGLFGAPPITVLVGAEAHVSVFAALQLIGLGRERVTPVAVDEQGRIDLEAFEAAVAAAPEGPLLAIGQAGHINSGALDPIGAMADLVHAREGWLHVDGAFGLWARVCRESDPAVAAQAEGLERADSWGTDGHKWLQTPYDCGYAIVRDAEALRRAMAVSASYLIEVPGFERNPGHTVPELSRRGRGFATWATLRGLGRRGVAGMIARNCAQARRFAGRLQGEPGITVLNEVVLNQVAVRFGRACRDPEGDAMTRKVVERIQAEGIFYAGGANWRGQEILRLSICGWATTDADIDRSAEALIAAWRAVSEDF